MKTVAFYTLGCKVNQYETNLMIKQFEDNKYTVIDFENKPDVFVINSCSVTNLSTRKTRQILSRARKLNDKAVIILVGCYAEEINFENTNKLINNADIILGNEEKKNIVEYLNNYIQNKDVLNNKMFKVEDISKVKRYVQKDKLEKSITVRESIKIEDGCNNFCSYCIIPYTRGRVRSRSLEDIVCEVKNVAKNGSCEIILVGIEIASYGLDLKDDISLIDVIEQLDKISELKRIRLRFY
ncbi:MAG: radical SAM protein [Clostridia bacterium]